MPHLLQICLLFFTLCDYCSVSGQDVTVAPTPGAATGFTSAPTPRPTVSPQPTVSTQPSIFPTVTPRPSESPSVSPRPSIPPTGRPTITPKPSITRRPTALPSARPSQPPSSQPTFAEISQGRRRYRQTLMVANDTAFLTPEQVELLGILYSGYTPLFAPNTSAQVLSECAMADVRDQRISTLTDEFNNTEYANDIEYTCTYTSRTVVVIFFPNLFLSFINSNLDMVLDNFTALGFRVLDVLPTNFNNVITLAPTASHRPSTSPSLAPTITGEPTFRRLRVPTSSPTLHPEPTSTPTRISFAPTRPASESGGDQASLNVPLIASLTILAGFAVLLGLVFYYRRQKKQRQELVRRRQGRGGDLDHHVATPSSGTIIKKTDSDIGVAHAISPSASMASNKSLLSAGSGLGDESGDENDGTKNLQDEFDQYKDQNLEQLRSDVEGNLSGFEGIMSAAVTKALMGDEDAKMDPAELLWGCQGYPSGDQVEASALCEVTDWIKRNESTPVERKRAFMQEMLNKMVASVRFGVIGANDASRTIHESAALLGLQIANDLPMTTVLVSGMRKTVEAAQMVFALKEFGDIDTAAVASGERGFGIVRFRHPQSVERAMRRYRNTEIVVQDVAVQIKVLMPSGEVQSRA